MVEFAERLADASDAPAVGEVMADACAAALPHRIYTFVIFPPEVVERPQMVLRSEEHSPDWLRRRFGPMLHALSRDIPGGLTAALRHPGAFLLYDRYPIASLRDTELWVDHWAPVGCGQQLSSPLYRGGEPVGYVNITRSQKDARFGKADVRTLDQLRVLAERALLGVAALGHEDLAGTLRALTVSYPHPAFLFEGRGRLRWMSDEGAVRLGVEAARLAGGCLVRSNAALEALRRCAAGLASDPLFDADLAVRRDGLLGPAERLAVRRFGDALLLALVPSLARLPGEIGSEAFAPLAGLGAVESRVARLAAEGYTVLNIAARLGVTEATVRTHLRRVYVKVGVHSRAELAHCLWRGLSGDGPGPDRTPT